MSNEEHENWILNKPSKKINSFLKTIYICNVLLYNRIVR